VLITRTRQSDLLRDETETDIPANMPYISANAPCTAAKDLFVSAKEPNISAKEPYISTKEPYISRTEPYFPHTCSSKSSSSSPVLCVCVCVCVYVCVCVRAKSILDQCIMHMYGLDKYVMRINVIHIYKMHPYGCVMNLYECVM